MKQIAPHEGRELELVLSGLKPMAVVSNKKDPEQYTDIYWELTSKRNIKVMILPDGEVAFSLVTEYQNVRRYKQLRDGEIKLASNEEYKREMGKLFGYTEEEIQAFIDADIQCDCIHCKGMSYNGD